MKLLKIAAILAMTMSPAALMAQDKPGEGVTVRPVMTPQLEEMFQHRILFRALKPRRRRAWAPLERLKARFA